MKFSATFLVVVLASFLASVQGSPIEKNIISNRLLITDRQWNFPAIAGQSTKVSRKSLFSDVTRQKTDGTIKDTPAPPSVVKVLANLILINKINTGQSATHLCTATVIGKNWLLTAATCVSSFGRRTLSLEESYAFVGEANATLRIENTNISPFRFKQILVHKEYDSLRVQEGNDIALIQLDRSIEYSKFAKVSLSQLNSSDPSPMESIFGAGYGFIANPSQFSSRSVEAEVAMEVPLKTESFEVCKARTGYPVSLEEEEAFCALPSESENGLRDICLGDSGGPLYTRNSDGERVFQFGIISFANTIQCAQPNSINWNTRISHFYRDIVQGLNNNLESWNILSA